MNVAIRSALGNRDTQQDRFAVAPGVIVVADGMGGRPGGGEAAQAAVAGVLGSLAASGLGTRRLEEALVSGNQGVRQVRLSSPDFAQAATTVTAVAITHVPGLYMPRGIVAHVGDSPAFLVRRSDTILLTRPHTVTADPVAETSGEPASLHTSSTLTRHLGSDSAVPDVNEVDLEDGDRLLVATDGLLDGTDPRRIRELATAEGSIEVVADTLLAEALREGSDNVTIVVIDPFGDNSAAASST